MIISKYDLPDTPLKEDDAVMQLAIAADNCAKLFGESSASIYVYYSKESQCWIICDNFDRGEYNAIRCYDDGRFTIWDSFMLKEFSYVTEYCHLPITNYDAAYQHAKQFFRSNATSLLKSKECE